ncbi:rhodanese-like domain-containing protein [Frankia tisae]|uniref:rhodanese-like domain-containing protein n=1 Tax=Frankia tisae TaxID=2950104 RepID=UPI0021BFFA60|nr:rhodanese-like domain-containing protein [Frankia tisae]
MTITETTQLISVAELRAALLDGGEIAVADIREGDDYAAGHISVAVPIPDSELELAITTRVPRRGVRLVVADQDGGATAESAATRLASLGYNDVRILQGGVPAWAAAGNELITGLNSLSKALGEFVERGQHTPRITVEQLKAKLDNGEDVVVLDTRPLPEYRHIAIPSGHPAPGAELLYRVFDHIQSPTTQVVVNCAGRTRAIIGAQALINAGVTNPVVSLENGTSAWLFAGYEPVRGAEDLIDAPSPEGLSRATDAAVRIRTRFGVGHLDGAALDRFHADDERTTYVLDVRTPEEFVAGHLPGAVSAPGGQLVQATDLYVGTRNARIVLADSPDLVRSSITASWLRQLGLDEVSVYAGAPDELTETGTGPVADPVAGLAAATISVDDLAADLATGKEVTVIDLQPAPAYFETPHYLPGSVAARRSTLLRDPTLLANAQRRGAVVLTSSDGRLARLAAAELTDVTGSPVLALAGGIDAWVAAGHPTATGTEVTPLTLADALPPVPDLEARRQAFSQYVSWGDRITDQLERDGLVQFREFRPEGSDD